MFVRNLFCYVCWNNAFFTCFFLQNLLRHSTPFLEAKGSLYIQPLLPIHTALTADTYSPYCLSHSPYFLYLHPYCLYIQSLLPIHTIPTTYTYCLYIQFLQPIHTILTAEGDTQAVNHQHPSVPFLLTSRVQRDSRKWEESRKISFLS